MAVVLAVRSFGLGVDADGNGDRQAYELAALNQTSEPWANENGRWKQDD